MALQELTLELPNRPGALIAVARILAKERINLAALSVDATPRKGHVRLVVSDPARARQLLKAGGFKVETHELIAVRLEDRSGSFLQVLELLSSQKINLQSVAILIVKDGTQSLVAFTADDLPRARQTLRQGGFLSESVERLISNRDLLAHAPAIPPETVGLLL